jgi:hypothetical protein
VYLLATDLYTVLAQELHQDTRKHPLNTTQKAGENHV